MFELYKRILLKGVKSCKLGFYKYVYKKQPRVNFKLTSQTSKDVFDYVHSNIWGSIAMSSNKCAHYSVSFIDDFSKNVWFILWSTSLTFSPSSSSGRHKQKIRLEEKWRILDLTMDWSIETLHSWNYAK